MPIIDAHVHLYPAEVNADPAGWAVRAGEAHWAKLCTRTRRDGRAVQDFPSVRELLRTMDAAGVDRAVLLGWYWENPYTARWHNRFYAECLREHPDRLSAFASLHPGWTPGELQREVIWARNAGFAGLGELSPHSQGFPLASPEWQQVLALASEQRWPINLHVTEPDGRGYPGRVDTPLMEIAAMASAHPDVRFILAHWGGRLPLRAEFGFPTRTSANVFFDTAASPLIYSPGIAREMAAAVGPGRVLWGTDYPLNLYPRKNDRAEMALHLAEMRTELSAVADLPGILGGNAARLLGLS